MGPKALAETTEALLPMLATSVQAALASLAVLTTVAALKLLA